MQAITERFDNLAKSYVRPISWEFRAAFEKIYDDTTEFFQLDTSILDGNAVLSPESNNPIQAWDFYTYYSYTSRVVYATWTREITFPYSVSSAISDICLNNYDNYFTPNGSSPLASYILPSRPFRILVGFGLDTLNQFVGFTDGMPSINNSDKTITFNAVDRLSEIYEMETSDIISMSNVRTDEVLSALFTQFGLSSSSYSLDEGLNVIPFLFYEEGTTGGEIIKNLMQAELGNLWINEEGIIIFNNRYKQFGESVYTFDETNLVSISGNSDDNIINNVKISSSVRELKEYQSVYSYTDNTDNTISANSTAVFSLTLDDPCSSITEPTLGEISTDSWFTSIKVSDSSDVLSGVSCTGHSLKNGSISIFFENTNSFDVIINNLEIWGYPAKIVDSISYTNKNDVSIAKYGLKTLEINNDFIQSISQCDSIAAQILLYYSDTNNEIEIEVKGNPALQLYDTITLDYQDYSGEYCIVKTVNKIQDNKYTQIITARSTVRPTWFTLDSSILDGEDVLAI